MNGFFLVTKRKKERAEQGGHQTWPKGASRSSGKECGILGETSTSPLCCSNHEHWQSVQFFKSTLFTNVSVARSFVFREKKQKQASACSSWRALHCFLASYGEHLESEDPVLRHVYSCLFIYLKAPLFTAGLKYGMMLRTTWIRVPCQAKWAIRLSRCSDYLFSE